jgi:hypothetical protein
MRMCACGRIPHGESGLDEMSALSKCWGWESSFDIFNLPFDSKHVQWAQRLSSDPAICSRSRSRVTP